MEFTIRKEFDGKLLQGDELMLEQGAIGSCWSIGGHVRMLTQSAISCSEFDDTAVLDMVGASVTESKVNCKVSALQSYFSDVTFNKGELKLESGEVRKCVMKQDTNAEFSGTSTKRTFCYDCEFRGDVEADANTVFVRCRFTGGMHVVGEGMPVFVECAMAEEAIERYNEAHSYY